MKNQTTLKFFPSKFNLKFISLLSSSSSLSPSSSSYSLSSLTFPFPSSFYSSFFSSFSSSFYPSFSSSFSISPSFSSSAYSSFSTIISSFLPFSTFSPSISSSCSSTSLPDISYSPPWWYNRHIVSIIQFGRKLSLNYQNQSFSFPDNSNFTVKWFPNILNNSNKRNNKTTEKIKLCVFIPGLGSLSTDVILFLSFFLPSLNSFLLL